MSKSGYYIITYELPDGKHLGIAHSIWAYTDKERAFVFDAVRGAYSINPDLKYDPATFLTGPFESPDHYRPVHEAMEAALNAEDPQRKSVREMVAAGVMDSGERLLHDPEISRMLAAHKEANKPTA